MIHVALHRPVPLELTDDGRVAGRVTRLAGVSLVALGVITWLAAARTEAPPAVVAALAAGWILMPLVLVVSLRRPGLRYGLVLPSTLVTVGLLAICLRWLPADPAAAAGWLSMLAGVLLGGGMGAWLWFRMLPVPASLQDPLAPGRWALIGVHVGLVVAGLLLVLLAA